MIPSLTPFLTGLGPAALLVVMAIVFAETGLLLGFFLPGDSLLFTVGVLTSAGVLGLPFGVVALGVLVAAFVGDQVGYLIGRRGGPRVFNRPESRLFSQAHADRAQAFFARHGSKAVVLARFVPVVRTFAPVVAGVGRMPYRRFLVYNLIGALTWGVGVLTAGYFLGGVPFVADHVELIVLAVVAVSVVPVVVAGLRHRARAGRSGGTTSEVSREAVGSRTGC
ncbi:MULTISPECIES: DedA family protein [unclassified Nocardioides]|uniref:DedA family protein n=1 Tax=unclassified Nocardioides TaxID=2615069 RepID=UPI000A7663C7|nr:MULTISPECIES: VTT domain-containing protein [unclassified Nocardioides]